MLALISAAARACGSSSRAPQLQQLQQLRFLNIHEYQSSQLMAENGVNVPPGVAVQSLEDLPAAVAAMADEAGDVSMCRCSLCSAAY